MQYDRNALKGLYQSVEIPKINLSIVDLALNRSQVAHVAAGQVIYDPDVVPGADESLGQM
jgi:hypothetical protein